MKDSFRTKGPPAYTSDLRGPPSVFEDAECRVPARRAATRHGTDQGSFGPSTGGPQDR